MRLIKKLLLAVFAAMLLFSFSACKKEGPAERAGKDIDKAINQMGKDLEKAGKDLQKRD